MKTDIHHHFIPEILKKYVKDFPEWTTEKSLEYLQTNGLERAVLSLSDYDIDFESEMEYVTFCKEVNNELRNIIQNNKEHLSGFAILPFPYIDKCIEELHRITSFGFEGVILYTNVNGVYPSCVDHPLLFNEFDRMKIKLFVHPGSTPLINNKEYKGINAFIEYPQDVARLISRLLTEDFFEKYKNISLVLAHGGGIFPYQFTRIGKLAYLKSVKEMVKIRWGRIIGDLLKKRSRVTDYLNAIEFDLNGFDGIEQTAALFTWVKREQCHYGSNYPYVSD